MKRFWSKVDKSGDCWEWKAYKDKLGYGFFNLTGERMELAHRVAWKLVNGEIPEGDHYGTTCVCHHCDNPSCVNPAHLFLGSHTDNMKDMTEKKRNVPQSMKGSKHPNSKLTEKDVIAIRSMKGTASYSEIGKGFGIGADNVYQIMNRIAWKHI